MENIICVNFKVESEAYQAMTQLKAKAVSEKYIVSQAALIKKENGRINVVDGLDSGFKTADDTLVGGLVGSLVGILGGPLGVLLGGSMGTLAGGTVDVYDAAAGASMIEEVAGRMEDGEVSIIAFAQEEEDEALDAAFTGFETVIIRRDAAVVAEDVRHAAELQAELEREARRKLREEKKGEYKEKIEEQKAKFKAEFDALKNKFERKE